jgi:hypothetical protein
MGVVDVYSSRNSVALVLGNMQPLRASFTRSGLTRATVSVGA